ncbi:uncharacterized protein LOC131846523 [Achroia grisella]|uniref:uncharacterized protein LOC131846523 n=1 Tax=Achroia grisella TaxID=688607 RepID=UPI0027D2FE65|nr:uncharacterized protein LOC131846523 [Achroia grisella]
MVVQLELDLPLEMPFGTKTQFEVNQCVVVKNHMKELKRNVIENVSVDETSQSLRQRIKRKKRSRDNSTESENKSTTSGNSDENLKKYPDNNSVVCPSDIEELRSIYNKCRTIVEKIEKKYGHLLNIPGSSSNQFSNQNESIEDEEIDIEDKCTCTKRRKIIYDDDGIEISKETDLDTHICPSKLKSHSNKHTVENVLIEYEADHSRPTLPDDIPSLSAMLHDPHLEITCRNQIVQKMKLMKQEYANEIRFNKPALIELLKTEPDEVFEFKGTNLITLKGYS